MESVPTNHLTSVPTSDICTHMLNVTWKLRVSEEELGQWKEKAAKSGMLLSEWIRAKCNGSSEHKEVRESRAVSTSSRREPVTAEPLVGICANCEHKKTRHGGFKGCCQEDNCLCAGFE